MNCKVCGNTSTKNTSLSFFRFPRETSKCRDWAERCHLLALFEKHGPARFYKSFRICSQHFDPKHVVFDGRKNKLLNSAIPHLSPVPKKPSTQDNANNCNFHLPQNLCRLCAKEDDNLIHIFGWRGRLFNLETKLKYLPQAINKNDALPVKICNRCMTKVNQFYDFILNCTKAETKLKAMLDAKVCSQSKQSHQHSAKKATSNQTPKVIFVLAPFPGKGAVSTHYRPLIGSVTPHGTAPGTKHVAPDTNHKTPDFPKNVDHDYLGSQLLPTSMENAKFRLVRQDGKGSSPRPPPKDQTSGESCESREKLSKKKIRAPREKRSELLRCNECDKFLRSKASLRQHWTVHSNRRPYSCGDCGKSFKRKDSLRNHVRIHTGERPYLCQICGFSFKRRGDCISHEKNHEKDDERFWNREPWGENVKAVESPCGEINSEKAK